MEHDAIRKPELGDELFEVAAKRAVSDDVVTELRRTAPYGRERTDRVLDALFLSQSTHTEEPRAFVWPCVPLAKGERLSIHPEVLDFDFFARTPELFEPARPAGADGKHELSLVEELSINTYPPLVDEARHVVSVKHGRKRRIEDAHASKPLHRDRVFAEMAKNDIEGAVRESFRSEAPQVAARAPNPVADRIPAPDHARHARHGRSSNFGRGPSEAIHGHAPETANPMVNSRLDTPPVAVEPFR